MLIKTTALNTHLRHSLLPVYVICGSDTYFLNETKVSITRAWRQQALQQLDADAIEKQSFEIGQDNQSWVSLASQLQSYNLFCEKTLYQIRYNKGTLDKAAQRILADFAESNSTHATVIIIANQLKQKSLTHFEKHQNIGLIPVWPLKTNEFARWVDKQLKQTFTKSSSEASQLVTRFCQNNPYAVRQVIAKLKLTHSRSTHLDAKIVSQQLSNQCEFQVFELSDACLEGNSSKVLQILTHLRNSPSELNLLLWVVSKDIRSLLQLYSLCQTKSLPQACQLLGIWRSKISLYQAALKRINLTNLNHLCALCHTVDKMIKTGQTLIARHTIENMALSLTTGKEMLADG